MNSNQNNFNTYLQWRGDLTFKEVSLNIVDALLLTYISYVNFNNIVDKSITIEDANEKYFQKNTLEEINNKMFVFQHAPLLLNDLAKTNRFRNLKINNYKEILDLDKNIQFAALTIELDENNIFISFRGTDENLIGWKEDCYLAINNTIPSQIEAIKYINSLQNIKDKNIYIGGHSKGGNLAIYTLTNCNKLIKQNIVNVFSFDNPGFSKDFINCENLKNVKDKIISVIPRCSLIGMMFENIENRIIVDCSVSGLRQHDAYYWKILGNKFVEVDNLDIYSVLFKEYFNGLLEKYSKNDIQEIVDGIFQVFLDANIHMTYELQTLNISKITEMLKAKNNLSSKTKEIILDGIKYIFISVINSKKSQK